MRKRLTWAVPLLVPMALWLWLFHHLHFEWSLNPQYHYGWAVPFLAAFAFSTRWSSRPNPEPLRAGRTASGAALVLLLTLLLPLRLIEEANPDWRLLSWTLALVVVAYSLISLARAGGGGWVRHFAFPVCFPLVGVPWLVQIENVVVQALTRAVAYAAVEIAGWLGLGAFQHGNIIELHNGFVGVDEACSGVKTLQAAIMVSLILGELFQLRALRRIVLLLGGCGWMFACNVLRAATLVVLAARQGTAALERWHDVIGAAVLIAGMAGLVALAWFLQEEVEEEKTETARAASALLPLRGAVAGLAWLLLVFGATEYWYRSHERELVAHPGWSAHWPAENPTLRELPIPETTRAILRYDVASSAAWEDPRGVRWWGFFGRWEPQRAALQLVRSHSPEICLPAVGRTFRRELEPVTFQTEALPLRFRVYEFEQNDRPLFVFVSIQEDKTADATKVTQAEWNTRGRLRAAADGQRNLGQRLLELAVIGFDDFFRAREAAARAVDQIVERSAGSWSFTD